MVSSIQSASPPTGPSTSVTAIAVATSAAVDVESIVMCDFDPATSISVPFVRHYKYDDSGARTGYEDTTPDGIPYSLVGAPVSCATSAGADSEFGSWCAFDAAGTKIADVVIQHVVAADGTIDHTDILNVNGTPFVTPYSTIGSCPAASGGEVSFHEMCDDINGDGTVIETFVEVVVLDIADSGAVTRRVDSIWTDRDMSAAYTPINPIHCADLGASVIGLSQHRRVLSGPSVWERPALATAVTVSVLTIGDPLNPPTVTDCDGVTSPLVLGSESWSNPSWGAGAGVLVCDFTVTTFDAADVVVIATTEIHS